MLSKMDFYNHMSTDFPDYVISNGLVPIRNQILWNLVMAIYMKVLTANCSLPKLTMINVCNMNETQ